MSESDQQPAGPPSKLDRFGLPPVKRGMLRGKIRDVRHSIVEGAYGQMQVIDFNLYTAPKQPPVPVQMRGNDFTTPVRDDWVIDVADPDPTIRPLLTRRITLPHNPGTEVVSYYPGWDDPNTSKDRFWSIVAIAGPLVGGAILVGLLFYFGIF